MAGYSTENIISLNSINDIDKFEVNSVKYYIPYQSILSL